MDGKFYQQLASRTINKNLYDYEMEQHALHGMVGEIGELHSLYQKSYQGHDFDEEHAKRELGDLLWFIAEYCTANDWDLNEIMNKNFRRFYKMLNWKYNAWDDFKRFLVEGILAWEIVYDSLDKPTEIIGLIPIDPARSTGFTITGK